MTPPALLRAVFVRAEGRPDAIHVTRPDGSGEHWTFPTYGNALPHDLVHLVAESGLGLANGFWGRVASGASPARVNAQANRKGGKDKFASFGPDHAALLVAEAAANARWWDATQADAELSSAIAAECPSIGVQPPRALTLERVHAVRETLEALRARWCGLLPKGALELVFDPKSPEAGFAVLRATLGLAPDATDEPSEPKRRRSR